MKLLLIVVGLALVVLAEEPILLNYHEEIGIPEAARLKRAEEAQDFDGSRIVGGSTSDLGAHPFMGGLLIDLTDGRRSMCGSSLLSATRLVTAAHCWRAGGLQARQFTVILGTTNFWSGGVRIETSNVQIHANYNEQNLNNDIAIISIPAVGFNNNIQNIALAGGNNNFTGTWAVAAGYGRTSDTAAGASNSAQRHVSMQIITNAACAVVYGSNTVIQSTLCTATTGGNSTCSGDSGGPLFIGSGISRQLVGIASFVARAGCTSGLPAGFARVTSFRPWILARL